MANKGKRGEEDRERSGVRSYILVTIFPQSRKEKEDREPHNLWQHGKGWAREGGEREKSNFKFLLCQSLDFDRNV